MSPGIRRKKEKQYQEHIRKAQADPAGIAAYCRRAGISVNTLNYWRSKVRPEPPMLDGDESPAFLPVQVIESAEPSPRSNLPDPRWVAKVMLHLARGVEESS
jgi:transposase-like protein